jgi:hypothetical protein
LDFRRTGIASFGGKLFHQSGFLTFV